MNTTAIAAALRALADAIELPSVPAGTAAAPASAPAPTRIAPAAAKRGPGRPPSASKPAASAPAPTASAPAPAPAPTRAAPSAASASAGTVLTHAIVANDFKIAALAHGRDFVKGLLDKHQAPTFDKVKDLAAFQAQLRAGPQAASAPAGAADDLLG